MVSMAAQPAMLGYLSHYFEKAGGPFKSLSELSDADARTVQSELWRRDNTFAARRRGDYLDIRRDLEATIRREFVRKGGRPRKWFPYSMVVGSCDWLLSWYREAAQLKIRLGEFDPATVSFTYGDMFPAMRYADGKPYRGQVYLLEEMRQLVGVYGLPQDWNGDGSLGPDRYIEAQIWSDDPVGKYKADWEATGVQTSPASEGIVRPVTLPSDDDVTLRAERSPVTQR